MHTYTHAHTQPVVASVCVLAFISLVINKKVEDASIVLVLSKHLLLLNVLCAECTAQE